MSIRPTARRPGLVATGRHAAPGSKKRAPVYLDATLFNEVHDLATRHELALSTVVRELLVDGLAFRAMSAKARKMMGATR